MASEAAHTLHFEGCSNLRLRVVLSFLTRRPLHVSGIRPHAEEPGLTDPEVRLLRLVDALSIGTQVRIYATGTEFLLRPGMLRGGTLDFDCGAARGLGYFLQPLLLLAPFCKSALTATLTGCTDDVLVKAAPGLVRGADGSVDAWRLSVLPILRGFLGARGALLSVEIQQRGCAPAGGGQVQVQCPAVSTLTPLALKAPGKVFRIRGVAWTCGRLNAQVLRGLVSGAKSVLTGVLSDTYITADQQPRLPAGSDSYGFGISLTAETKGGVVYCAEAGNALAGAAVPAEVGRLAACRLLEQVARGGCCDVLAQPLCLTLMALCQRHVSEAAFGALTDHSVHTLRLIDQVLGVRFQLSNTKGDGSGGGGVLAACMGSGLMNLDKTV